MCTNLSPNPPGLVCAMLKRSGVLGLTSLIMAKFATECLQTMAQLTKTLDLELGEGRILASLTHPVKVKDSSRAKNRCGEILGWRAVDPSNALSTCEKAS